MRRTTWLLTFGFCGLFASSVAFDAEAPAEGPLEQLVIDSAVEDNLALLFTQFRTELVLCLEGEREGSTLRVTDFHMPHILLSEPGRVQATGCGANRRVVGTWHNHPGSSPGFLADSDATVRGNCYLSRTDIGDFLRRTDARVSVVACGPRTYAYWWRRDVEDLPSDLTLLAPPAHQLAQGRVREDTEAGNLTQAR